MSEDRDETLDAVRVVYSLDFLVAGNGYLARVRVDGRALMENNAVGGEVGEGPSFYAIGGNYGWCGCGSNWREAWYQFLELAPTPAYAAAGIARTYDEFAAAVSAGYAGTHAGDERYWGQVRGADAESAVRVERLDLAALTPECNGVADGPYILADLPVEWGIEDPPTRRGSETQPGGQ